MPKYTVIVNVNLQYEVEAEDETEAEEIMQNLELPQEYVEGSYDFVKAIPEVN